MFANEAAAHPTKGLAGGVPSVQSTPVEERTIFQAHEIDTFAEEVVRRRRAADRKVPAACLSIAPREGEMATAYLGMVRGDPTSAVIYGMAVGVLKLYGIDASSPEARKAIGEHLARFGLLFNDTSAPTGGFTPRTAPSVPGPASFDGENGGPQ